MKEIINESSKKIKKIILGQTITVKFFFSEKTIEQTGMVIKIDLEEKILHLPNRKIPFSSIINITTC